MQANSDYIETFKLIFSRSPIDQELELFKDKSVVDIRSFLEVGSDIPNTTEQEREYIMIANTLIDVVDELKLNDLIKKCQVNRIKKEEYLQYLSASELLQLGFSQSESDIFLQQNLCRVINLCKKQKQAQDFQILNNLVQEGIKDLNKLFSLSSQEVAKYALDGLKFQQFKQKNESQRQNISVSSQQEEIQFYKEELIKQIKEGKYYQELPQRNGYKVYQYPHYQQNQIPNYETYKSMIVLGQTGSGKSTLVNYFLNYFLGVQMEDNYRFVLVDESNNQKSQALSQTSDVTMYFIKPTPRFPYGIRIIDTPGFGDTRGLTQDRFIVEQIKHFFTYVVDTITSVCFVVQASNARLTVNQNYILSSMLSMFGKDIVQNFTFMLTFCDGGDAQVIEALKFKGDRSKPDQLSSPVAEHLEKITEPKFLYFNSSAQYASKQSNQKNSEMYWKMAYDSFREFQIQKLEKNEEKSLSLTRDVIRYRDHIQLTVQHLRVKLLDQMNLLDNIRSQYREIKILTAEQLGSQNYKMKQKQQKTIPVDIEQGKYITNCITCNFTCHSICSIADDDKKSSCVAMGSNGNCQQCKNKCHWTYHKNQRFRWEFQTIDVEIELKDLKQLYVNSISKKSTKEQILAGLENDYIEIECDCMELQELLRENVNILKQIAAQPTCCDSQEQYIDLMIDEETLSKKEGYVQRVRTLKEMKENVRTLKAALQGPKSPQQNLDRKTIKNHLKAKNLKLKESDQGCICS